MKETCGDTSSILSKSALLQWSLENKLKQLFQKDGLTSSKVTSKVKTTPSGARYLVLVLPVHHICEDGYTGEGLKKNYWKTPTVSEFHGGIRWALKDGALDGYKSLIKNGYLASHHFGLTENGLKAQEGKRFCLNTELSRWLMGFPRSWSNAVDTVTP